MEFNEAVDDVIVPGWLRVPAPAACIKTDCAVFACSVSQSRSSETNPAATIDRGSFFASEQFYPRSKNSVAFSMSSWSQENLQRV